MKRYLPKNYLALLTEDQTPVESFKGQLKVLLIHVLKWHYQPWRRSNSWKTSIKIALDTFDDILSINSKKSKKHISLKALASQFDESAFKKLYSEAAKQAEKEMRKGNPEIHIPKEPEFDWHDVLTPEDVENLLLSPVCSIASAESLQEDSVKHWGTPGTYWKQVFR